MAKNKKKHSSSFVQQQQKSRQAQSRSLFEDKMRSVCELIGDKSLYDVIPITERTIMYLWRGAPLTVEMAKGKTVIKGFAERMESVLRQNLDVDTIELIPGSGKRISMNDYFWAVVPMEKILKNPDSEYFPGKELFYPFMKDIDKRYDEYLSKVFEHARMFCKMFEDISQNLLFAVKHEHRVKALDKGSSFLTNEDPDLSPVSVADILKKDYRLRQTIVVSVMHVDEKQLTVDGETLQAKQLGMVSHAEPETPCIMPFHATPKQLKLTNADKNLRIPVYFTEQVFNNIFEYTGCSIIGYAALYLRLSVHKGIYIPLSDNTFLMEYRMMNHKVGYVVAELTNDVLLLRSFRLVTHSSTPEGAKLQELAKKHEEYKDFLLLDNVRPIVDYGLIHHSNISRIFCKAGCKPLLDFCRQICEEQDIAFFNPLEKGKRLPTFSFDLTMKGYTESGNKEEFFM